MKPRRRVLGLLVVFIVSLAWLDNQSGRHAFAYRAQVAGPTGRKDDPQRRVDAKKEGLRRPIDEPEREGRPKAGREQRTGAPDPTEEGRGSRKPAIEPAGSPRLFDFFDLGYPIIIEPVGSPRRFDEKARELDRTMDISRVASEMSRIKCGRFPGSA